MLGGPNEEALDALVACFRPEPEPQPEPEPEMVTVTVRRKISAYTDGLMRVVTTYHEMRVPAGQVPDGWEVVNDE
jgi:hypothetical protein